MIFKLNGRRNAETTLTYNKQIYEARHAVDENKKKKKLLKSGTKQSSVFTAAMLVP